MSFLEKIFRLFSLIIASVDGYVVYSFVPTEGHAIILDNYYLLLVLSELVAVGLPLSCIWFSAHISEFSKQRGEWAPIGLIKFAGWAFLLVPVILFIWYKMK